MRLSKGNQNWRVYIWRDIVYPALHVLIFLWVLFALMLAGAGVGILLLREVLNG